MDMGNLGEILLLVFLAVVTVGFALNFVFSLVGVKSVGNIEGNLLAVFYGFLAGVVIFPCLPWCLPWLRLEVAVVTIVVGPGVAFYVARRCAGKQNIS